LHTNLLTARKTPCITHDVAKNINSSETYREVSIADMATTQD